MSIPQLLQQAVQYLQAGDHSSARVLLQRVQSLAPNHTDALHLLAMAEKAAQNSAKSEELFRRCLQLSPERHDIWGNYANFLQQLGFPERSEQAYQQALRLQPQFVDALVNSAILALSQGQLDLAYNRIDRALGLHPNHVHLLRVKADILKKDGEHERAMEHYNQVLAADPHNFHSWHNKGVLLRELDQPEQALQCFLRVAAQGQTSPEYMHNLACAASDCGNYDMAEQGWLRAVQLKPDFIDAHVSLNNFYWEHQRHDQFLQSFANSLQAQPDSMPLRYEYARFLMQTGKHAAEAETLLQQGLQIHGAHPALLHALSVQHFQRGAVQEAQRLVGQAIELDSKNSRYRIDLANYLIHAGHYQEAEQQLEAALALEPENQEIWAYLGTCWRLTANPKHDWLNNYDHLVKAIMLPVPDGYESREAFIDALVAEINQLHLNGQQPLDQSVRGGTQTIGRLLSKPQKVIQDYRQVLEQTIAEYLAALPSDPSHPLLRRNSGKFCINGSWSVRLNQQGFHSNHVHPQGWLSACTYLTVPDSIHPADPQKAGWLKLGETSMALSERESIARSICPQPGMVVLFPSYVWHGTVPFAGNGHRMTAPCDISSR